MRSRFQTLRLLDNHLDVDREFPRYIELVDALQRWLQQSAGCLPEEVEVEARTIVCVG